MLTPVHFCVQAKLTVSVMASVLPQDGCVHHEAYTVTFHFLVNISFLFKYLDHLEIEKGKMIYQKNSFYSHSFKYLEEKIPIIIR